MVSAHSRSVIARSKKLYADRLQTEMEATHRDQYVAIEPDSGDYFLSDTLDEAVNAAIDKHPDRITHVIRVGHIAAIHMGVMSVTRPTVGSLLRYAGPSTC
jgi:hypothetical protein